MRLQIKYVDDFTNLNNYCQGFPKQIAVLESPFYQYFKIRNAIRVCDCVSKKNTASLKTHEKCGFKIVSDKGYDYLSNEESDRDYSLEYNYVVD